MDPCRRCQETWLWIGSRLSPDRTQLLRARPQCFLWVLLQCALLANTPARARPSTACSVSPGCRSRRPPPASPKANSQTSVRPPPAALRTSTCGTTHQRPAAAVPVAHYGGRGTREGCARVAVRGPGRQAGASCFCTLQLLSFSREGHHPHRPFCRRGGARGAVAFSHATRRWNPLGHTVRRGSDRLGGLGCIARGRPWRITLTTSSNAC
jgi:hypothetical protein